MNVNITNNNYRQQFSKVIKNVCIIFVDVLCSTKLQRMSLLNFFCVSVIGNNFLLRQKSVIEKHLDINKTIIEIRNANYHTSIQICACNVSNVFIFWLLCHNVSPPLVFSPPSENTEQPWSRTDDPLTDSECVCVQQRTHSHTAPTLQQLFPLARILAELRWSMSSHPQNSTCNTLTNTLRNTAIEEECSRSSVV